jgi:transcriptional regulator with XRE-family HTH domain
MKTKVRRSAIQKSFAANLRREREARGLSQEALAHDAGLRHACRPVGVEGSHLIEFLFSKSAARLIWLAIWQCVTHNGSIRCDIV